MRRNYRIDVPLWAVLFWPVLFALGFVGSVPVSGMPALWTNVRAAVATGFGDGDSESAAIGQLIVLGPSSVIVAGIMHAVLVAGGHRLTGPRWLDEDAEEVRTRPDRSVAASPGGPDCAGGMAALTRALRIAVVFLAAFAVLCWITGCSPRTGAPPSEPLAEEKGADPNPAAGIDKLVRAVVAAKNWDNAAAAYRELLGAASNADLQRLKRGPSDSVAVQAAWEEVERSLPVAPARTVRPERDRLARFIGFLEERARVRAPGWWAEALLDARANRRFNVYGGGINIRSGAQVMPKGALTPDPAAFARVGGKLVVRAGSTSAPVPEDLPEKLEGQGVPPSSVSALITRHRCFVAVHDSLGPYRLAAVDRPLGKVRWVTQVWGSSWANATGQHHRFLEVTEQGDRVVVFGIETTGFHVEAFRAEDGAALFRFSNFYGAR
jgi:hypothetical protein